MKKKMEGEIKEKKRNIKKDLKAKKIAILKL